MPKVNPEILLWARKTAGLSPAEACRKLRLQNVKGASAVDRLTALETGVVEPSRPMLLNMAKQYHRPLLVFYMSKSPRKGDRGQDFRTLPEQLPEAAIAIADVLLRDVQARQSIVRATLEDEEEAEILSFVGSMEISDGIPAILESIRRVINFDEVQYNRQHSAGDAFSYLRSSVEEAGVYVLLIGNLGSYHTAIAPDVFRGFALADDVAPFVVINDQDSQAAWSFTLLHELTHIWLGQTGISSTHSDSDIEKFCNKVASEFLLPEKDLNRLEADRNQSFQELKKQISNFAFDRNLSSTMVAYRLYLAGRITKSIWSQLSTEYKNLWNENRKTQRAKSRKKDGGPSYYVIRRHRVGGNLIALVHHLMVLGALTTTKAARVLGVKANNVQKLIEVNSLTNPGHLV
jgi:Zn-dependent peptidase ImmA (M78 family)